MQEQLIQTTITTDHIGLCSIIVQEKWNMQILFQLIDAPKRYNQIASAINQSAQLHNISPKILSKRLKQLGDKGLIVKQRFPTVPPSVQYQITDMGTLYSPVLIAMEQVGKTLPDPDIKTDEFDLGLNN